MGLQSEKKPFFRFLSRAGGISILLFIINGVSCQSSRFTVPTPQATAILPKGFRVSIPDVRGIVLFAFHGNINKQFSGTEVGEYHAETRRKTNNEWVFETNRYQLQIGDVLYFWIYVQHDQSGYILEGQRFVYPDDFRINTSEQTTVDTIFSNLFKEDTTTQSYNRRTTQSQRPSVNVWPSSQNNNNRPSQDNDRWSSTSNNNQRETYDDETQSGNNNNRPSSQSSNNRPSSQSSFNQQNQNNNNRVTSTTRRTTTQQNDRRESYDDAIQFNSNDDNNQQSHSNTNNNRQTTTTRRTQTQNNNNRPALQNNNNRNPSATCERSITTNNNQLVNCKNELIFEEQFNGNSIEKWSQDLRIPLPSEDAEFVLYHKYQSVWNVSNGNLHIFPKLLVDVPDNSFSENDIRTGRIQLPLNECTPIRDPKVECERKAGFHTILPPVVSARFRSKKTFTFKYGKVDIRAKLPKGDWMFPQLYLEPSDNSFYGITGFANGLMRVAFIRGNKLLQTKTGTPKGGQVLNGGVVVAPKHTYQNRDQFQQFVIEPEHLGNQFHTYSMIWTNESIKFEVDGKQYGIVNSGFKYLTNIPTAAQWQYGTLMAPFDREFYIALGVGVGGLGDFPDESVSGIQAIPKPWENTSPKAELNFWLDSEHWRPTWNSRDSGLIVDFVKVYSV